METHKLWQGVLGELETEVSPANFTTWLKDTAIISVDEGCLSLAVPNIYTKDRIETNWRPAIVECLKRAGVLVDQIEYKVVPKLKGASGATKAAIVEPVRSQSVDGIQSAAPAAPAPMRPDISSHLHPRYTLDDFVVGGSNELAYAASQAVVKYPGDKYNPLFLYGGVGLGKTHLVQAIGNELLRRDPGLRVRYVTSEEFTNEYIDSVKSKRIKSFSQLYRNLDVLIVDDIQFIGNKEKTQEEFFHTFNTLHQAGKQIILSSDKPPRSIPNLEPRLRSRFEMGMAADVQRPDLETRAAIVQLKAGAHSMELPSDVVEHLARGYQHNIRELEGALTQLVAYCELRNLEPSLELMKEVNGGSAGPVRRRVVSPKLVIERTAAFFDILPTDITGTKRDKEIVVPRQIAMYLMRTDLNLSFPQIAAHVGGRDHSTAMHSVRKIDRMIESNADLRHDINQVKERINL